MRRSVLRLWIGTGIVTGAMLCGCRQLDHAKPARSSDGLVIETMPELTRKRSTGFQCSCPANGITKISTEPPLHEMQLPSIDLDSLGKSQGPTIVTTSAQEETASKVALLEKPAQQSSGAHHSEYHWLVGVLEHGPEVGTLSVRYASSHEADRYGGQLVLVAPSPILGYRIGQMVRVQGHVVQDQLRTEYQVERIETLGQR